MSPRLSEQASDRSTIGRYLGSNRRGPINPDFRQSFLERSLVPHSGRDFLPDIAALAEVDAVQALESGLENVGPVGNLFDVGFRNAVPNADIVPVHGLRRRGLNPV